MPSSTTPARTAARARAILVERERLRPLRRAARRGDTRREGRRPRGRRDRDGAAHLGGAPRDRRVLRREASRSSAATSPNGQGFWYPGHARRGAARRPHRARGGLRPGRGADPVRRRGRGDPHRERLRLRPLRLDLDRRTARGRCASRARSRPGVLSINSNSSVRVSTPFGGFKQSGFGRELGMHGLAGYTEVKNVFYSTEG